MVTKKAFCISCSRAIKKSETPWCILCRAKVLLSRQRKKVGEIITKPKTKMRYEDIETPAEEEAPTEETAE
jgi:hypothetical protein